jgi:hypothetical protein
MRYPLVHFETTEGPPPEGGGEPEPPPEDAAVAEAPALDIGAISQMPEFQEAIGQAVFQTLGQLAEQPGEEGGPEEEFDPYDPDAIQRRIDQLVEQRVDQRMSRYEPTIQQMEVANWQDKIEHNLSQLETVKQIEQLLPEDTPADHRAAPAVQRTAMAFLPEMEALYGSGDRAVEASLRAAADYELAKLKQAHGAGYAARNAELARLSGAPAPAPAQGGPAEILDEPGNELEAAERYAARHGLR